MVRGRKREACFLCTGFMEINLSWEHLGRSGLLWKAVILGAIPEWGLNFSTTGNRLHEIYKQLENMYQRASQKWTLSNSAECARCWWDIYFCGLEADAFSSIFLWAVKLQWKVNVYVPMIQYGAFLEIPKQIFSRLICLPGFIQCCVRHRTVTWKQYSYLSFCSGFSSFRD